MRAISADGVDILPTPRKIRALLAFLCLAQGEVVARSRLAGIFWDRSGEAQARTSLRQALSELNRIVNASAPGLVQIRRDAKSCHHDAQCSLATTANRQGERKTEQLRHIAHAHFRGTNSHCSILR